MALGRKTGGRQVGSANKARAELLARCQKVTKHKNYHPVIALAIIALDEKTPTDLRIRAHCEVAKYTTPQVKAIELSGEDGGPIEVRWAD